MEEWCTLRNFDRGIVTATRLASVYTAQLPIGYRAFDGSCLATASKWNQPIGRQVKAPARPCKVYAPRAIGITLYEVLTDFVDHTLTAVAHFTREAWDVLTTDSPT